MMFTAVIILGTVTAVWYCVVVVFLRRGLGAITPAERTPNGNCFSIIIAARNEAENIGRCLDSVLAQSIAADRYEVIVVNDRSVDATPTILDDYAHRDSRLSVITVTRTPPGLSPKKYAVAQGVAAAHNEIIVFTDADCCVPPQWIATLDRYFVPATGLVQGITAYRYPPGMDRLFFGLQALDFLSHGIVAASAIGARLPINSNANNFAFRKKAFLEAGGLTEQIGHVVSGDDDLLLQKIWRCGWNIVFMADAAAAVETEPTPTARALFQQRARWGSKTVYYNCQQVLLLSGIFLFYCTIVTTFLVSLFTHRFLPVAALLLLIKFGGECLLMLPGLRLFGHRTLAPLLPVASLLQLPLVITAVIAGVFGKFNWKEQSFSRTMKG